MNGSQQDFRMQEVFHSLDDESDVSDGLDDESHELHYSSNNVVSDCNHSETENDEDNASVE
jgi:hypothetical protein